MSRGSRERTANDVVLDAWRFARRLGHTSAERIAVFNTLMLLLERRSADAVRAYAKTRLSYRRLIKDRG
jgi:hypothetical protein